MGEAEKYELFVKQQKGIMIDRLNIGLDNPLAWYNPID